MAYIGRPLNAGNLAVQSGTGDGSDTTPIATLDYSVGSSNSIAVYLDGVRQLAGTDFTAAGTTLTFTTAPANGVGIDVYFLGLELSIPTPADATVSKSKITTTLINEHVDTTITAADSILFSDATDSTNKKDTVQGILDLVPAGGSMTPTFAAYHTGTITVSDATATAIVLGSEYFDTDSAYNVSDGKFTVPSGEDGKYWFSGQYRVKQGETNTRQVIFFRKNGSLIGQEMETRKAASTGYLGVNHSVLVSLAAGDYVQLIAYFAGGGAQDTYDYSFYGFKLIE